MKSSEVIKGHRWSSVVIGSIHLLHLTKVLKGLLMPVLIPDSIREAQIALASPSVQHIVEALLILVGAVCLDLVLDGVLGRHALAELASRQPERMRLQQRTRARDRSGRGDTERTREQ